MSHTTQIYAKYASLEALGVEIMKYFGQLQNSQRHFLLKTFATLEGLSKWICADKKGTFGRFTSDNSSCTGRKTHLQEISHTHTHSDNCGTLYLCNLTPWTLIIIIIIIRHDLGLDRTVSVSSNSLLQIFQVVFFHLVGNSTLL